MNFSEEHNLNNKKPALLLIVPTRKCNLKCPWCIADRTNQPIQKEWKEETYNKLKDMLNSDIYNIDSISFSGGEPLLKKDIIKKCINIIKEYNKNMFILIHTNGYFLDNSFVNFCNDNNVSINVSFNGSGYKSIDNLINFNNDFVNNLIRLNTKGIRIVVPFRQKFAEDVIYIHKIFPKIDLYIAFDFVEYKNWNENDIIYIENELIKIKNKFPYYYEFLNLLDGTSKDKNKGINKVIIRFNADGTIAPKYKDAGFNIINEVEIDIKDMKSNIRKLYNNLYDEYFYQYYLKKKD